MNFNKINKTIRTYIKFVNSSNEQIDKYVRNNHLAEVFKGVLIHADLENTHTDVYHNVKHNVYDSIGSNNPDDYEITADGKYLLKKTYSVGINHLLLGNYFDLKRLDADGVEEIKKCYQKLRRKEDEVRNLIVLARIVLPHEFTDKSSMKANGIRLKK